LLRPRVWVYSAILLVALSGILYGLSSLDAIELKVLHERAPLFVTLSDGSIQNKYTLKVLNKMNEDIPLRISASGPRGMELVGADEPIVARNGFVSPATVFVKVPRKDLQAERMDLTFVVEGARADGQEVRTSRESVFIGPRR
jgi:polyferredoxin